MENNKTGTIYCLTCPLGKSYIGQTVRKLHKRLEEHEKCGDCRLIHEAIQTNGMQNIKVSVLFEGLENELDAQEKKYIKEMNTLHPNGYNIRIGGSHGSLHCEASREKMRQSKLGEKNHNFGKPRSDETKKKISQAKAGENHHFFGKTFTPEHKAKCAKAHRKNAKDADLPMYLVRVDARPEHYIKEGFAVMNHPSVKNKSFCSGKITLQERYNLAYAYLQEANKQLSSQTK